ncbi:hypothetical protein BJ742DRAFT_680040 [Cladochytrium replicatum]|nr:hypothetical protein BJ742DRAFT_680040 [Cladochytrium replicatum]
MQGAVLRGAAKDDVLDAAQRRKAQQRRIDELEKTNFTVLDDWEAPGAFSIATSAKKKLDDGGQNHSLMLPGSLLIPILGKSSQKRLNKKKREIQRILLQRRNLQMLLSESKIELSTEPTYLTASQPPSRYPPRKLCTVCGYLGAVECRKCGMRFCPTDLRCKETHLETRCMKFVS